ncbi:MAG: SIMPL domain-containing protein [Ignavibacteria bacterium]|nr:SIMPL domain-containing protein [Ignavibacteria bacterium]
MRLLLIIFLTFYGNLTLCQQDRIIEVTGTSEILVSPDKLNWIIQVRNENNSVQTVKTEIDRSTKEILNVLKLAGVLESDIQTSGISLNKSYNDNPATPKFNGYNSIFVKLSDINSYVRLLDKIIDIKNSYPQSPQLLYSKEIELRSQAREQALLSAKKKAADMVSVLGLNLGGVIKIIEQVQGSYYSNPFNSTESVSDSGMRGVESIFREGQISISASVRVTFELGND